MTESTVPAGEVEAETTPKGTAPAATESPGPEVAAEPEGDEPEGDGEQGEDDGAEEIEFDLGGGQKIRVPANATAKEIAEHAQRSFKEVEGNWTRKNQEVAELRKSVEAQKSAVDKMTGLNGEILETYSQGMQLRAHIERLQQIDTQALWQSPNPEDRDRARRVSDDLAAATRNFQALAGQLNQKEIELGQTQQAENARLATEGKTVLQKHIKDFDKVLPEIIDYAVKVGGMSKDAAERDYALNPWLTVAVHESMLYRRMQAANTKASPKPPPSAPVTPMKAKGTATARNPNPSDDDDTETWMKKRNAQLRKKTG